MEANKTKGTLIFGMDGEVHFRVRADCSSSKTEISDPDGFIDYRLVHNDLDVIIDDIDSYFYRTDEGDPILDHHPDTLGYYGRNEGSDI